MRHTVPLLMLFPRTLIEDVRQIVWVLLLTALPLSAQGRAVEGAVVNSTTGAPLSGVYVLLWAVNGPHYEADTDTSGHFRIENIPPGSYFVRFEKAGFVALQSDADRLFQEQSIAAITKLAPDAAVRGRVINPDGSAAGNARVEMSRARRDSKSLAEVADGDGAFAFSNVEPGAYYLRAAPKPEDGDPPADAQGARNQLEPTYFPSVIDFAQAAKVTIPAGAELTRYDIHLQALPVYRVGGRVLNEERKPVPHSTVRLVPTSDACSVSSMSVEGFSMLLSDAPAAEAAVESGDDGSFEFPAVRPGSWDLVAANQNRGGTISTVVADKNIEDLEITAQPSFGLDGAVDWGEGQTQADRQVPLFLCNLDSDRAAFFWSRPDGTIRLRNLLPGRYRLALAPYAVQGEVPIGVFLGARDVTGLDVDLATGSPPIRILYGARAGAIQGTVDKGGQAEVLLLPKPFAFPELVVGTRATADGTFNIPAVPAGDYYAVAVDHVDRADAGTVLNPEAGAVLTAEVFRRLVPLASSINVAAGSTTTVNLSLARWPE